VNGTGLGVLAFNWHEPYLALLARTGFGFLVADWPRRWNAAFRPRPANARLVRDPEEARALAADRRLDLVLCQTPADLDWVTPHTLPVVYLAHNRLDNEVRGQPAGTAEALRERVRTRLARTGGRFVAISEMKRTSWGLDGVVIPPGLDCAEYGGWTGERTAALTVGNFLAERDHMLGYSRLAAALTELPWRIIGTNPALGVGEAKSWDALRAAYRIHRLYAHATQWPWEDGWNLALLEAMATGMPVVAWANPTTPIREGLEGFVADGPEALRRWARRLIEDIDLARRLGERARDRVAELFPLDAFLERWRTVLLEAADPARRAWPVSGTARGDHRSDGSCPAATEIRDTRPACGAHAGRTPRPARHPVPSHPEPARFRIVLASAWTPISTAMYYARAFRAAGHDVLTWGPHLDARGLAQWRAAHGEHALKPPGHDERFLALLAALSRPADVPAGPGQPSTGELLARLPTGWRPDLFVWIDGGPEFLPLDLERLDCPSVCLLGDTHTQLDWRAAYARAYERTFVMFNRQHVPRVRDRHGRVAGWLPAACDPELHRTFDVEPAFDVVFVGQTHRAWHPERVRLLEHLAAAGLSVWAGTEALEDMALALRRGRIVFNRSLAGDLNMRVFEALATGSFLLTDRLAPEAGLETLLADRVHLVCYDDAEDLEALARRYLARPDERAAIARAGRAEVLRRHTYRHRAQTLLAEVFGPDRAGGGTPGDAPPAYYLKERPEVAALVPPSSRRILEVGCAAGRLGARLKRTGPREVVGIEADPAAAAAARLVLDRVIEADVETLERACFAEGAFDCVVCADVLEHLRDPRLVLGRIRDWLAPGGTLVASVPNVRHAGVLTQLLVHGRWRYEEEGILDRTHLRFFTRAELEALLEEAGFRLTSLGAVFTHEHPLVERLAALVAEAGGDAARLREEARVFQYLVTATPAAGARADLAPGAAADAVPASSEAGRGAPAADARAAGPSPASDSSGGHAPAVSIVIPVCNRAELTRRCLEALARTVDPAEAEVIVVDNGSTDDTAAVLASAPPPVRVLRNAANLGFARASNQGARAARGELLVFLNNDTEPEPGWLQALRAAAAEPGVGLVGARLLYPGTRRIQHAGLALNPGGVPDHLWRHAPEDDPRAGEPRDLDMVTGACLAIRRELFLALGGFDEGYRNGCEDVDLCLAVRARGLRVRYEPRAVLLHHEGATAGRFDHVQDNLARLEARWGAVLARMPRRPAEDFGSPAAPVVIWEGAFFRHHSLALVNRELGRALLEAGLDVWPARVEPDDYAPDGEPAWAELARRAAAPLTCPVAVRVRHRFPPDFARRPGERLVLIQPWEFGAAPADWVRAIREHVDELWVPSEWVRQSFVASGVPAERVVVVPNGVDLERFRPEAPSRPLPVRAAFRFLFVGGGLHRKGVDLLLEAFVGEFTGQDDVCLVVKDHPFYGTRLEAAIARARAAVADPPEIVYLTETLGPDEMPGLYAAATCLVHPFRGEGFGLPILEAMACGRPVIVTDAGPVREFCPDDAGLFVPAARVPFVEDRVENLPTVGRPWLAEPHLGALRRAMRWAVRHPEELRRMGARGAEAARRFTWQAAARRAAERLAALGVPAPDPRAERLGALSRLAEAGRLLEALGGFARLVTEDPNDRRALLGAAHCALALGRDDLARPLLERLVRLDPADAAARAALEALAAAPAGA
jgi:GT2 family glycosyltransferase/2-polyprenyl-3-methyl-5-hydroxy-6-metoxy-1,4-benzoquinol methylase